MPVRSADAQWDGKLKSGSGTMRLSSGAYEGKFTFGTRFEETPGTNPEEFIGAALAGCFSMAFAGDLEKAGHDPKRIATTAEVNLSLDGPPTITSIDLRTEAEVPNISEEEFQKIGDNTRQTCPIARVLNTTINLDAKLSG